MAPVIRFEVEIGGGGLDEVENFALFRRAAQDASLAFCFLFETGRSRIGHPEPDHLEALPLLGCAVARELVMAILRRDPGHATPFGNPVMLQPAEQGWNDRQSCDEQVARY